jgi:hypothetical protein
MRLHCSDMHDHEIFFAALGFVLSRATTTSLAALRSDPLQPLDLQDTWLLPTLRNLSSLPRCGAIRTGTRTRSWRDRDVQLPKSFMWSLTRPANRLCPYRRSPIHASSIWSGFWRDRPHVTSSKPKQTTGRETASRSKEVVS